LLPPVADIVGLLPAELAEAGADSLPEQALIAATARLEQAKVRVIFDMRRLRLPCVIARATP
jgi:hypothetical protein